MFQGGASFLYIYIIDMLLLEIIKVKSKIQKIQGFLFKNLKKDLQLTKSGKTINNLNQPKPQQEIKMQH